jgi:hypothetical protein
MDNAFIRTKLALEELAGLGYTEVWLGNVPNPHWEHGMGDGIVAVSGSLEGAATALLDQLVEAGREIVTIVTGADASPAHTDALMAWLGHNRPGVQVEVHRGGQPLYPYLFGVE